MLENEVVKNFVFHDNSARPITETVWSEFLPTFEQICREKKFIALLEHEKAVITQRWREKRNIYGLGSLQYLPLASSFFTADDDGSKRFYFFNNIHSVAMYPPLPDHLLDRERPKTLWDDDHYYHINVIDLGIPDALLTELKLPLTTTMTAMQSIGSCFTCGRCHEAFQKVMDWPALVRKPFLSLLRKSHTGFRLNTISMKYQRTVQCFTGFVSRCWS